MRLSRKVASSTRPVRPWPPQVASKTSAFSVREQVNTSPVAVSSVKRSKCWENEPSLWWFLPCTSAAMAPPIVTNLVPGVTGMNQPLGTITGRMSA